ncbi:hypothetical protein SS50377_28695 [Spironucleus salmonicida]|uniref:Uncharacterized protein n=1 Tax=Spironucleus salmonicida TaxID=348837 RepID=A0A9P8RUP4_9EUKA|nr:hypothetical protein SS50377_28695 [Spironucleus salmonicida]
MHQNAPKHAQLVILALLQIPISEHIQPHSPYVNLAICSMTNLGRKITSQAPKFAPILPNFASRPKFERFREPEKERKRKGRKGAESEFYGGRWKSQLGWVGYLGVMSIFAKGYMQLYGFIWFYMLLYTLYTIICCYTLYIHFISALPPTLCRA